MVFYKLNLLCTNVGTFIYIFSNIYFPVLSGERQPISTSSSPDWKAISLNRPFAFFVTSPSDVILAGKFMG